MFNTPESLNSTLMKCFSSSNLHFKMKLSGQSIGKGFVRASLSAIEPTWSRLLWLGIPREFNGNKVLVGFGKSFKSSGWIFACRSNAEVLCQILRTWSGAAWRRIHALFVLSTSKERLVNRKSTMQWQHSSSYGQLHRSRFASTFFLLSISFKHLFLQHLVAITRTKIIPITLIYRRIDLCHNKTTLCNAESWRTTRNMCTINWLETKQKTWRDFDPFQRTIARGSWLESPWNSSSLWALWDENACS